MLIRHISCHNRRGRAPKHILLMNFARPVFLARANLVFFGIRYKHLEYRASRASPFYNTKPTVSGRALSAHTHFQFSTFTTMTKLAVGDTVPVTTFTTFKGETVSLENSNTPLIHIQFRRHAGCPICDLHLRSIMKREDELTNLGVSEIVFFHSNPEELKKHTSYLPFPCIADPTKTLYKEFGTEEGRGIVDSFTWHVAGALLSAVGSAMVDLVKGERQIAPLRPTGGRDQFPADFLVNKAGKILAVKYGKDIADQWSVNELFEVANSVNSECGSK